MQAMLNGQKSGFVPVTIKWCSSGSVLGPLLFTIFVNDIPSVVSSPTFMFADDSYKDFSFCKKYSDDHTTLQNDLNVLHECMGSVHW